MPRCGIWEPPQDWHPVRLLQHPGASRESSNHMVKERAQEDDNAHCYPCHLSLELTHGLRHWDMNTPAPSLSLHITDRTESKGLPIAEISTNCF